MIPRARPIFAALVLCGVARSVDAQVASEADAPVRPSIAFYRWQEDWSVLADPRVAHETGDALKYIRLDDVDPKRYVSFGVTLRERYEFNDAPAFGVTGQSERDYLIHRLELHADAHLTERTRVFVQIENALAVGLARPGPADANKLDLRLAFLDASLDIGEGLFKYRIGRQEMAFDLQRFISVRDGPNVRQAYDAVWADYEKGEWRMSAFVSEPVQYRNASAFDDVSNRHLMYGGARIQRRNTAGGDVSVTVSAYRNDTQRFANAAGEDHRRNVDLHYAGTVGAFDWDIEGMQQQGSIAGQPVSAWALGSLQGWTWTEAPGKPRLGFQADAASGDRHAGDGRIESFNPMFPNGYYVTLTGFTGYTNFIHAKPSLTLTPRAGMKVMLAEGSLWRQSTDDAVYLQPSVPVPNTAGRPGRLSATYTQARIDWTISRSLTVAFEADHYNVGAAVLRAGGHDSDYAGLEARWGW